MKNIYAFLIVFFTVNLTYSQDVKPIQATTGATINHLLFDNQNNQYYIGSICGRVWINGVYNDSYSQKYQPVIGKLTDDKKFEWLIPLSQNVWDAKIQNNKIQILYRKQTKSAEIIENDFVFEEFDLKGNRIQQKSLMNTKGKFLGFDTQGKIFEDGILTWTTWKSEKENTTKIDNKTFNKKLYSLVYFKMVDFDGNEKWTYQIEGGSNGFTDLRIQNASKDNKGNIYVFSYYSHIAELGIASFKTNEIYPEVKKLPLHFMGIFLLKFNSIGKPIQAEVLSENTLEIEDVVFDDNDNLLVVGYHNGNDVYAKKQKDGRPYIGAKIRGETFQYSDKMNQIGPSDDGFVVKLDTNFNVLWKKNFFGEGNNRVKNIKNIKEGYAITGLYSNTLFIDDKKYEEHPENKGYSDGFYAEIDFKGNIIKFNLMTGENSNIPKLFTNFKNEPFISVGTKTTVYINDIAYKGYGHWGGTFIYRP